MSRKNRNKGKSKRNRQQATQPTAVPAVLPNLLSEKPTVSGAFLSNIRKEKAAQLIAEGDLTITAIAANLGVNRDTIYEWQRDSAFFARVEEIKKDLADLERRFVFVRKTFRIMNLEELLLCLQRIRDARSVQVNERQGGDSGFVVRRQRMIGSGPASMVVEEYVFDSALFREWRETLGQIAKETGQHIDKLALTSPDGKREYTGTAAPDLEEFRKLPVEERIRILRAPIRSYPSDGADRPAGA